MMGESPGHFSARTSQDDGTVILSVAGELDISSVGAFADSAYPVADSAEHGLVVDLSEVRFLSSSAITVLVRIHDRLPSDSMMALVADQNVVVQPVRLSGIDRVMSTFADVASAVAHVRSRAGAQQR